MVYFFKKICKALFYQMSFFFFFEEISGFKCFKPYKLFHYTVSFEMCSGMNKNDHEGETKNLNFIIFLWKVYLKVQNTTSDPEEHTLLRSYKV